jgi:hypothetical protein
MVAVGLRGYYKAEPEATGAETTLILNSDDKETMGKLQPVSKSWSIRYNIFSGWPTGVSY